MKIIILIGVLMMIWMTWLMVEGMFVQACYEKYDRSFTHKFIWHGITKGFLEVCVGDQGEVRIL